MKIIVAGDYCPQDRIFSMIEYEDYSFIESTKRIISQEKPDLAVVNFETAIISNSNSLRPIKKSGPSLSASPKAIGPLKYAGFNLATLANNHIMDYGRSGLSNTITALEDAGINHVGTGNNLEESSLAFRVKVGGESVSVINCCEHEFSVATESEPGAWGLDPIAQYNKIVEEKKNSNYVVVIVHGGPEFYQNPTTRMVKTYRFFIDAGADVVINGHQHCFSGYENYKGRMIFYGLGNFCFDWPNRRNSTWNEGYLISVNLSQGYNEFKLFPYNQCDKTPSINYLNDDVFDQRLKIINEIIADEKLLQEKTNEYYSTSHKELIHVFEPQWRFYQGLKRRGLVSFSLTESKGLLFRDFLDCESHRDKILYYLRNKFK